MAGHQIYCFSIILQCALLLYPILKRSMLKKRFSPDFELPDQEKVTHKCRLPW
jgi:hypothetical protein